jgi:transcriptional regulator with XRE-family HTH domain
MANIVQIPIPVKRALRKLGSDIRDARRRRRIPTQVMAERTGVSRTTLLKVEKGDPGVSFGTFATVLFVLGLLDGLSELAGARYDQVGLDLADEQLPQRIRLSRRQRAQ